MAPLASAGTPATTGRSDVASRGARIGVDLVDVPSFRTRFDGQTDLLATVFTEDELAYCRRQYRPWVHLAARFAAKEAVWKALGTGFAGSMTWKDVEVRRDAAGAPGLILRGTTAAALEQRGLGGASLSLAHTRGQAIAFVMLWPG